MATTRWTYHESTYWKSTLSTRARR